MSRDQPFDMQLKLLTIGDTEVGKTCLIWRFASDQFSTRTMNTIGIDFKIKNVKLDDTRVKLQIWDTAGQERFRTITTSYFRGAQGIILVYDVTDRNSFQNVRSWMRQIEEVRIIFIHLPETNVIHTCLLLLFRSICCGYHYCTLYTLLAL